MAQEVIDRVDDLIRKNNIKYMDEQSQKAYQLALKQYEKHSKKQLTKQYAEHVKQGNKKAIEKAKQTKKLMQKKKKRKSVPIVEPIKQEKEQPIKPRISENQISVFNRTVEARAERIIQQQQLLKLNKRLGQEKKRTKLYQLNQRCKKMLSRSHERVIPAKGLSQEKMTFLKNIQQKAFAEINQLDNIINNLVDQANQIKKGKSKGHWPAPQSQTASRHTLPLKQIHYRSNNQEQQFDQTNEKQFEDQYDKLLEDVNKIGQKQKNVGQFNNYLNLNTIIFEKSTEELLAMEYIPI